MEFLSLDNDEKKILLESLGYSVDSEGYVRDLNGKIHLCPYTNGKVKFENASILPGSTVIINTSAFTLSEYVTEYLEDDKCSA